MTDEQAVELLKKVFREAAVYDGPMPGGSLTECGNFSNLDMAASNRICAYYADLISNWTVDKWFYPNKYISLSKQRINRLGTPAIE